MKNILKIFAIIFSLMVLVGCKEKNDYSKLNTSQKNVKNDAHKIVVNEVIQGGSYTYINVGENNNKYWMAIPKMEVLVGETYYYNGGMIMKNFESKELDRTFDLLTFADGIRDTPQFKSIEKANPHATNSADTGTQDVINIPPDKNGISIAELFSNKENYSKKIIIVRGKVVKVNYGIMDKNWVHIKDGSQFENKNDLAIATKETVNVGDTVTFKGILALEKVVGKGYVYPVLLEEGELIQ